MEMLKAKKSPDWLMKQWEASNERYIEAERFLGELLALPWWKRIFSGMMIKRFLNDQLKKYDF